jgi:hypothetical protein
MSGGARLQAGRLQDADRHCLQQLLLDWSSGARLQAGQPQDAGGQRLQAVAAEVQVAQRAQRAQRVRQARQRVARQRQPCQRRRVPLQHLRQAADARLAHLRRREPSAVRSALPGSSHRAGVPPVSLCDMRQAACAPAGSRRRTRAFSRVRPACPRAGAGRAAGGGRAAGAPARTRGCGRPGPASRTGPAPAARGAGRPVGLPVCGRLVTAIK